MIRQDFSPEVKVNSTQDRAHRVSTLRILVSIRAPGCNSENLAQQAALAPLGDSTKSGASVLLIPQMFLLLRFLVLWHPCWCEGQ